MSDRTPPQVGEIWQHFKHCADEPHQYKIIVSSTSAGDPGVEPVYKLCAATNVDSGLFYIGYQSLRPFPNLCQQPTWLYDEMMGEWIDAPMVVYQSTSDQRIWCRTLTEFMAADERSETGWKFWRIAA